jgi:threonine dehydrogenase-like Zn-dependent dehydrogenase
MKAIQFNFTIPRYVLGLALGKVSPKFYWSGLTCTDYKEIPEPQLPGDDWVVVKTRLGGICGTDTSAVFLILNPYLTPLVSFPLVIGHENVGRVIKTGVGVRDWQIGERVVVEPLLWCEPRGFKDLCRFCARGEINRCERLTDGDLAPGIEIGACRDTGGSWSPFFVAHKSQLYRVPDNISNENGLMIEPFAIALHAVLQNFPQNSDNVLIIGAGTIGLCTLAALRALGSQAKIIVLGRHGFQADAAKRLGASYVLLGDRNNSFYREIVKMSGGSIKQPALGKPMVIGGVDCTFECVGNRDSLDDAMRLTRNGGRVILIGAPGTIKSLDWSPIFTQELELKSSYQYHHAETFNGKQWKVFDLAIELMSTGKVDLGWMVTHKFPLEDYRQAFELTYQRGKNKAIKIAFEFEE